MCEGMHVRRRGLPAIVMPYVCRSGGYSHSVRSGWVFPACCRWIPGYSDTADACRVYFYCHVAGADVCVWPGKDFPAGMRNETAGCGHSVSEYVAGFCRFPGNWSAGFADFLSCFPRGGFRPFLAGPFANGRLTAGNGFFAVGYRHAGRFFTAGCRQPEAVLLNGRFVGLFPDIFRFLRGDFICMVLDCFSGKGSRPDGRR